MKSVRASVRGAGLENPRESKSLKQAGELPLALALDLDCEQGEAPGGGEALGRVAALQFCTVQSLCCLD